METPQGRQPDPINEMANKISREMLEQFNSEQQRQFMDLLDEKIRISYNQRIEEQEMQLKSLQSNFEIYMAQKAKANY